MSSDKSVWLSIWVRPRETIRSIVSQNAKQGLWVLAAIYGFGSLLGAFQTLSFGSMIGAFPIFLLALVLSPFWGYILFAFWSWVVLLIGKWFKGRGSFQEIRASYAWSCVPLAINDIIWLITLISFGAIIFLNPPPPVMVSNGKATFLLFLTLCRVVLSIWSLVIYINALAEVQKFSVLRAIGNVVVSAIVVGIVLGILWMILAQMVGSPVQQTAAAGAALQILQEVKHCL